MIQSAPIFSEDIKGYVTLGLAIIAANAAMGGLVGYWIKNKNDSAMTSVTETLKNFGERLGGAETEARLAATQRSEHTAQRARDEGKFSSLSERLAKQEASMDRLEKDIHTHHREQRDLIQLSAEKQVEGLHKLELQIVALKEQSSLGDCMVEMGKSIERSIKIAMSKGG